MDVLKTMEVRASQRAFLDRPVSKDQIQTLLAAASRAPSALNLQPWELTVVRGEELSRLSRALLKSYRERHLGCHTGSDRPFPARLKARQLSSFIGLLDLLAKDESQVRDFINQGSLSFYGAPTAVIITKEKLFPDQYLTSIGIMLGYLILAAQALGLATCPIGLIRTYEEIVLDFINMEDRDLVAGLALGYADPGAPVNQLRTPREGMDALVHWYG